MSVLPSDIVVYGSANMQETDSGTQGGAIAASKRVVFEDISPTGNIEIVSSNAGDTSQSVTVTGRNAAGELISEAKTLNGQTPVAMTTETAWERLMKAVKSATTTGDVAVMAVTKTRSNTAQGGADSTASVMAYIDLDASASAVDDEYAGQVIRTTGGTGSDQIALVVDYDGAQKRAFVAKDWATVPDGTTTFDLAQGMMFEKSPTEVLEVRRPFYDVSADVPGGSARDFYEKIFFKNNHATLSLTGATLAEQDDPSGKVDFGLAGTLDDSATSTDRTTAPGGITFDSTTKNVANSQNHSAGAGQGVWLHLALAPGDAAQKTTYTLRESGSSV